MIARPGSQSYGSVEGGCHARPDVSPASLLVALPRTGKSCDTVSGRSLRLDGFGPPVEVCAGAQVLAVEFDAALGDDGLEIGKCRKVGVHDRLVEHGPETLRGLKLGCVARQMEQPDPVWNAKVRFGVPAGLVQHEHEAALAAGRA